jgi:F-type H+-transporting ATPase subunit delta
VSAFTHAYAYARAFLEVAPQGYDVERFLGAAAALSEAIEENATLRAFLSAPAVPFEAKRKALAELSRKAGVDAYGTRLFELLLRNHRVLDARQVLKKLREAYDAAQGVVEGRVTVASPIGEGETESLEEALAARVGGKVRLKVNVDPKILAGFVARVGSSVFDASVAAAIARFRELAARRMGA